MERVANELKEIIKYYKLTDLLKTKILKTKVVILNEMGDKVLEVKNSNDVEIFKNTFRMALFYTPAIK